jgi:hypothetical protein
MGDLANNEGAVRLGRRHEGPECSDRIPRTERVHDGVLLGFRIPAVTRDVTKDDCPVHTSAKCNERRGDAHPI